MTGYLIGRGPAFSTKNFKVPYENFYRELEGYANSRPEACKELQELFSAAAW